MQEDVTGAVIVIRVGGNLTARSPIHPDPRINAAHNKVIHKGCIIDFLVGKNCLDYFIVGLGKNIRPDELLHEKPLQRRVTDNITDATHSFDDYC